MTARHYLVRSLVHHRFAYLGVLAGAVLGATVLLGALFAGDSVRASLQRIAAARIGGATHVITSGDRFFRAALAADLAAAASARTAPVILARGVATHGSRNLAANQVQLVGVTPDFWQFAPVPSSVPLATASSVALNDTLARQLGAVVGDTIIIRVQKPGLLAGNAPVAGAEAKLQSLRCTVAAIVGDDAFGRFSLEATQVAQPSLFLPLATLQEALGREDRANLVLVAAPSTTVPALAASLVSRLQLADYGLRLKWLDQARRFELSSDRLFLDPDQIAALAPAVADAHPVVSYLVNELRAGDRSVPYSIGSATVPAAASFLPADLAADEAVVNAWLADELRLRPGDPLELSYFQVDPAGALVERRSTFRLRAVVPLEGLAADSAWMPDFPGITDVHDQSKWDPGLPLDLKRIREQDERYWDDYRGAPKVFLPLAAGRELWSTRWGNTTALRLERPREQEAALAASLLAALKPELNRIALRDVRAGAASAAESPVDFAGLFLGLSFFLILAALGLVAMLFQFVLLQRNREDALLAAVGISPHRLLRWRLAEGLVVLLLGALAALPLAMLYTRGVLRFLETIWSSSPGTTAFVFHASPASLAGGLVGFLVVSLGAIWLAVRRLGSRTVSIRLAAHTEDTTPLPRLRRTSLAGFVIFAAAALLAIGFARRGLPAQIAFYLAGFALLAAGLAACRWWTAVVPVSAKNLPPSPAALGVLQLKSRRTRSLTVVGLIATAVFMVLSVASFRKHVGADWLERGSGTGGFAYRIETTAPQNRSRDGKSRDFDLLERHRAALGDVVPLRVGTGDNADCFNLNSTAQPRLLAVDTSALAARAAFRRQPDGLGWSALAVPDASGAIPAFVDQNTLLWALKRKLGDVLVYTDEAGRDFTVRLVGTLPDSIFQGHLLVDENLFLQRFPSHAGYTVFLADARDRSPAALAELRAKLEADGRDAGADVRLTRDVLAAFHRIENTYIAIFNVLGSLGVVLGSLGLALVVARNLRERRGEFAVLAAVGLPRAILARMVYAEFGRLIAWGLAIGTGAAFVAILPGLAALPAGLTLAVVAGLLLGILLLNLVSGWLIFRWSTRDLRPAEALAAG